MPPKKPISRIVLPVSATEDGCIMTKKSCDKLPQGTKMQWIGPTKNGATEIGILIHDISYSFIDWADGQKTYTSDDGAMKYVKASA